MVLLFSLTNLSPRPARIRSLSIPTNILSLKFHIELSRGGVTGMVGSVQKSFSAKQIDDQTPVQVLSTDDNGAQVQIIDGPLKGLSGFVTKQNVN